MVSFVSSVALLVSAAVTIVNAQTSNVQCVYASWANNGDNQNPCQIWATLGSKCNTTFTVPALPPWSNGTSYTYPAPGTTGDVPANACQCNHIAYSLMAACAWCQEGVYSDSWVTEETWAQGCSNYDSSSISGVDIGNLNIPPYSLQPIPGPVWDPTDAQAAQVRLGSSGTANGPSHHNSATSLVAWSTPALLLISVSLLVLL